MSTERLEELLEKLLEKQAQPVVVNINLGDLAKSLVRRSPKKRDERVKIDYPTPYTG